MNEKTCKVKTALVAWFTGTGCTKLAAQCLEKSLYNHGVTVYNHEISCKSKYENLNADLLFLLFPVYALGSPEIVNNWIARMKTVNGNRAVVLSVSAGGEISPNTACRMTCMKGLQEKGYKIIYEDMIVMPSNFVIRTPDYLSAKLILTLPKKTNILVADVLSGKIKRIKPKSWDIFLSKVGKLEAIGAKIFGRFIKVTGKCTGCGWCIKNCPKGNITFGAGKPQFHYRCMLCLKCFYGCPNKAIKPGILKFFVFKEGFSLNKMKAYYFKKQNITAAERYKESYLWNGVTAYLKEITKQDKMRKRK